MASTRLANKPLADIAGLPMVVRVAQRAQLSQATKVVVAADDERIVEACLAHHIPALLTRSDLAATVWPKRVKSWVWPTPTWWSTCKATSP